MAIIIKHKLGSLSTITEGHRQIDWLPVEWHETNKRILHKQTETGRQVTLRFLQAGPNLQHEDVLFENNECLIAVNLLPCRSIALKPQTIFEAASICYEIGNKHLPLFFENGELLMPWDAPVFRLLTASGFNPVEEQRRLQNPLNTSVTPHGAAAGGDSLFNKILKLTTSSSS